jgi:hypothetical protein
MYGLLKRIISGKVFIKNSNLPICATCEHFIIPKTKERDDYEFYGRCKRFGKMNLVTGEIEYGLARTCRLDEEKCGDHGKEYSTKSNS